MILPVALSFVPFFVLNFFKNYLFLIFIISLSVDVFF